MNRENMLKLADFIESKMEVDGGTFIWLDHEPAFSTARLTFHMGVYREPVEFENGECGTAACLAGAACILFAEQRKTAPISRALLCPSRDFASWVLDIDNLNQNDLFNPYSDLTEEYFWGATPAQGASVLRMLADGIEISPLRAWHKALGLDPDEENDDG